MDYYNAKGGDSLNTFQFRPQPISFKVIDRKTFTEILYSRDIYDIIDYFVQEYVKWEQPMQVCKNCGQYFSISGCISAEYCDRHINKKDRICKDLSTIYTWNEKRKNDDVFKIYRWEYRKWFSERLKES